MTTPSARQTRRHRGLWVLLAAALLWFSGLVGIALRPLLLAALPRLRPHVEVSRHGREVWPDPAHGAILTVSRPRLQRLARELLGPKAWMIPPRLLPERYAFAGRASIPLDEGAAPVDLPFVVRITPGLRAPRLFVRLPSHLINQALDYEGSFASRRKTHTYLLGHYDTIHWLRFDTATITSELSDKELRRPITFRRLAGQATGQVRLQIKENIGSARTTARVKRMELRCDLDFKRYADGLAIAYQITIPKLDADINNVAPLFESGPTEALRKRLEASIARPRRLERMARRRFPPGMPLDLALHVDVFRSEPEP